MSWQCEACDTYNEDDLKVCFVCGQERSKESIDAALAALKEERREQLREKVQKSSSFLRKVFSIACMAFVLVSVAAAVLVFILGGSSLDGLFRNVTAAGGHAITRITATFGQNVPILWQHIAAAFTASAISGNIQTVWKMAESKIRNVPADNLGIRFSDSIQAISNRIAFRTGQLANSLAAIINSAATHFK